MSSKIRQKQIIVDQDIDANNNKITSLAPGTAGTDAVNKNQLDSALNGNSWKNPVVMATGADIPNLASVSVTDPDGEGQGVVLAEGDRVLVKAQNDGEENGIYVVGVVSGTAPLTRAEDANSAEELVSASVFVNTGDFADQAYVQTVDTIVLETTPLIFVKFTALGQVTAGTGLTKSGDTLNVGDANKGIQVNADDLELDASEVVSDGLEVGTSSHLVKVKAASDSINVASGGIKAGQPGADDKELTASVTSSDGDQATATALTTAPSGDSYIGVLVNGVAMTVGDGVKTKDCYFSGDGGTNARAFSALTAGDTLHWNGSIAGFQLDATDKIDFLYNKII